MAETTRIAWSRSTFNGWIGCTKISPECDHCYAESFDRRFYAGAHWGVGAPRKLANDKYWQQPLRWNAQAAARKEFWPVFCNSQADVLDNEVPQAWRDRLWTLIRATPFLTWQLVTKRIGNAPHMLPADWARGYPNVWLLSTIGNQLEADRDIDKLLAVPAAIHGISNEPALGPLDLGRWGAQLDWAIIGGESGARAREFRLEWAESFVEQCRAYAIAAFVKQMGHNATFKGQAIKFTGKGDHIDEWPASLRHQEFPIPKYSLQPA